MRKIQILSLILSLFTISSLSFAQDYHVRIGTIGNSITHGISLSHPETEAYPAQLGTMLEAVYGDTCIVKNFGLTTTTMLKNGDVSYWDCQNFVDYLDYAPEICFILLGTNDTKPQNWDTYGDEFIGDYLSMIDTIKQRNPFTKFILGYPPPAFAVEWGIRDSIIVNGVIPAIDSVLKVVDAELVDFYHPLLDSAHLFPDNIHPNVEGSGVMAKMILDTIVATDIVHQAETGLTFITQFKSSDSPIRIGDSTELSWTSINADSVFLDGELVPSEGSIKVSPPATTLYTLTAKGDKSNDTVQLTQVMYSPELSNLAIIPSIITKYQRDTILFEVIYKDQYDETMEDTSFAVSWNIIDGNGSVFDETDTYAYFVAEEPDTILLAVSYEDMADTALIKIRVREETGLQTETWNAPLRVYPNPCNDIIHVLIEPVEGPVNVKLFDLNGVLHINKTFDLVNKGEHIYNLKTDDLPEGSYILKVENSGKIFTGKIYVVKE